MLGAHVAQGAAKLWEVKVEGANPGLVLGAMVRVRV